MRRTLLILVAVATVTECLIRRSEKRQTERTCKMGQNLADRITQLEGDVAAFNDAVGTVVTQLQEDQKTIAGLRDELATSGVNQSDLDGRLSALHDSLTAKVEQLRTLQSPPPPPPTDQPNPPTDQTNPPPPPPPPADQPNPPSTDSQPTTDESGADLTV